MNSLSWLRLLDACRFLLCLFSFFTSLLWTLALTMFYWVVATRAKSWYLMGRNLSKKQNKTKLCLTRFKSERQETDQSFRMNLPHDTMTLFKIVIYRNASILFKKNFNIWLVQVYFEIKKKWQTNYISTSSMRIPIATYPHQHWHLF